MNWVVPQEWDGWRADRALARLAGVPRSSARRALESAGVLLDGEPVAPRQTVAAGAVLAGTIVEPDRALAPEPVDFGVVHEDADVAVVDKPAGLVTHPGAGNASGTLAHGLLHRWPSIRGVGVPHRWGIVHRLDRDTSGLLVVALSEAAYEGLTAAIRLRAVEREYLCLVAGHPETPTGSIDAPIGRDPNRPTRMRIDPDGRPAVTHYRVERSGPETTLLRVRLETGRTHQIRVHLGSIGLPVCGDATYGRTALAPRVFLHAARLAFDHPVTGERVDVRSPLPDDLAGIADAIAGGGGSTATGIVD